MAIGDCVIANVGKHDDHCDDYDDYKYRNNNDVDHFDIQQ